MTQEEEDKIFADGLLDYYLEAFEVLRSHKAREEFVKKIRSGEVEKMVRKLREERYGY